MGWLCFCLKELVFLGGDRETLSTVASSSPPFPFPLPRIAGVCFRDLLDAYIVTVGEQNRRNELRMDEKEQEKGTQYDRSVREMGQKE